MARAIGVLLTAGIWLLALAIPAIHVAARISAPPVGETANECESNKRPGSRA